MTIILDLTPHDHGKLTRGLSGYLDAVSAALGFRSPAHTFDLGPPASAYLGIDRHLPTHPDRDLALLWDERYGWSAAMEAAEGEGLTVLGHLAGATPVPAPERVAAFVDELVRGRLPTEPPPDFSWERPWLTARLAPHSRGAGQQFQFFDRGRPEAP